MGRCLAMVFTASALFFHITKPVPKKEGIEFFLDRVVRLRIFPEPKYVKEIQESTNYVLVNPSYGEKATETWSLS